MPNIIFIYNPRLNTGDQSAPTEPLSSLRPGDQNKSMIAVYFHPLILWYEGDDGFNNSCFDYSQYWEMASAVTDKHIPTPEFIKPSIVSPAAGLSAVPGVRPKTQTSLNSLTVPSLTPLLIRKFTYFVNQRLINTQGVSKAAKATSTLLDSTWIMLFIYKVQDKASVCQTIKPGYAPLALVPDLIESLTSASLQMIQSVAAVSVQTWLRTGFSDFSDIFLFLNTGIPCTINQMLPFFLGFFNLLLKPPIRRELNSRSGNVTRQFYLETFCHLCPFLFTFICGLCCRHHWPWNDVRVHLFTWTLCRACRIVLLDCILISALE